MITGVFVATWSVFKVAGLGAILAEVAARAGGSPLAFVTRRRWVAGERAALGFLLGWAACGGALLGIAATGLFYPPLVVVSVAMLAVGSRGAGVGRSRVLAMLTMAGGARRWNRFVVAAALAPAVAALSLSDRTWDSSVYHLGFAWQCLQVHRFPLDATPIPFWTPLPVDVAMALPLVLGDERVGKAIVILHLLALGALWQEACRRRQHPGAGWLGLALVLAGGLVPALLTCCKNDVPATALCVAGALLTMRGSWGAGAALLGCGVAAKFVYAPFVGVWLLAFPPRPNRIRAGVTGLLLLPMVPWLARSWLGLGHLGFPFAFSGTTAWDWSHLNQVAFRSFQEQLVTSGSNEVRWLPWTWLRVMWMERTMPLLLVPLVLFVGTTRRMGVVVLIGGLATLLAGRLVRYTLPADVLLALLAAVAVTTFRPTRSAATLAVIGVVAVLVAWLHPSVRGAAWSDATLPWPGGRAREGTSFEEALGAIRLAGARRVVSFGDWRTYRIPARVWYGGMSGETPVAWRMAREAFTPAGVRKRFRQLGADAVIFNFVSTEWLDVRYGAFAWDARMARLYVDFCRGYLEDGWQSTTCDYLNGGFRLYRLRRRPSRPPAAAIPFAPGIESIYADATLRLTTGDPQGAIASYRGVQRLLPDVGQSWNRVGHALMTAGRPREALPWLRKFGEAGMMDANNLPELGAAALRTGDRALADRVLRDVLKRYPTHPLTLELLRAGATL